MSASDTEGGTTRPNGDSNARSRSDRSLDIRERPESDDGLRRVSRAMARMESQLASLGTLLETTGEAVEELIRDRDHLAEELDAGLGRVVEQVKTALGDSVRGVGDNVSRAGSDTQEAITDALEDILARLDRGFEAVKSDDAPDVAGDIQRLGEQVDGLRSHMAQIEDKVGQAGTTTAESVTDALEDILARLDRGFESTVSQDALAPTFARLEEAVTARPQPEDGGAETLARIEKSVTTIADDRESERDTIVSRLDHLMEVVEGLAGSAGADGPSPEPPALAENVDRLSEQVEGLQRQMTAMQSEVDQARAATEQSITDALEDILSRLDRGMEATIDGQAIAAALADAPATFGSSGDDDGGSTTQQLVDTVGRLEQAVAKLTAQADKDRAEPPATATVATFDEAAMSPLAEAVAAAVVDHIADQPDRARAGLTSARDATATRNLDLANVLSQLGGSPAPARDRPTRIRMTAPETGSGGVRG